MKNLNLIGLVLLVICCVGDNWGQSAAPKFAEVCKSAAYTDSKIRPVTLISVKAELRNFLNKITEQTDCQFVVDKSVEESFEKSPITVSADEILWIINFENRLEQIGLGIEYNGKVFRIAFTETLYSERRSRGEIICPIDPECPLTTEIFKLNNLPNEEIEIGKEKLLGVIKRRLSKRGTVEFDDRSKTLKITDVNANLVALKELIKIIDVEVNMEEYLKQKKKREESVKNNVFFCSPKPPNN
jgi:type II secretory pathway component GspD/PulD (secretin)